MQDNKVTLRLPDKFGDCPQAWQNMITHLQGRKKSDAVPEEKINQELRKFWGRYVGFGVVEFEDEAHYMLWLLRWA